MAASSFPRGAMASAAPQLGPTETQCNDWTGTDTFEHASREYMRLASASSPDFGCVTRASWMAIEDLFNPENSGKYILRLKQFDTDFRYLISQNAAYAASFENFKILLQLRWLNESYEFLRKYKSSKVVHGLTGVTVGTAVVGGAAFFLHGQGFMKLQKAARPVMVRMIKYLGVAMFAKTATNMTNENGLAKNRISFEDTPPPMDLIGGQGKIYWNYSDLHLMRDIASILADTATIGATEAAVGIIALRYFGVAASAGGFLSASSIVGMVIGYPLSKIAAHYAGKALTDEYHRRYAAETKELTSRMQKADLTDWGKYSLGAELTRSSISWVATQDVFLQNYIEESVSSFSRGQICGRIRQHSVAQLAQENVTGPGRAQLSISAKANPEILARYDKYLKAEEANLRKNISKVIEERRERLQVIRQSLTSIYLILEKADKSYLHDYLLQEQSLMDRIDRYLTNAPIIDEEMNRLREHAWSLAPGSEKWQDQSFVKSLGSQYGCM